MNYQDKPAARATETHPDDDGRTPLPTRSRYYREPTSPPADVRIIRADDGGALRTFNGGLAHENGWFASRKARRLLHWEGIAQLDFITRAEVEFGVVRAATESVRFEFVSDGAKQVYTADVELVAPDGGITLVEIKRDRRDLDDPVYFAKLMAVHRICQDAGMAFKIVLRSEIWNSIMHRRNVTLFASRGFATVEPEHLRALEKFAERTGAGATYGDLACALEPHSQVTGEAIVQALTVGRRVDIDLTRPLLDETPLTIH